MTAEEYEMPFGKWVFVTKGEKIKLTEFGDICFDEPNKRRVTELYHELWMAERREFVMRDKNEKITNALMRLKNEGFIPRLCGYQNGHIQAKAKSGEIMSFYATTGTIAGYRDTSVEGLDEFVRLLKRPTGRR